MGVFTSSISQNVNVNYLENIWKLINLIANKYISTEVPHFYEIHQPTHFFPVSLSSIYPYNVYK